MVKETVLECFSALKKFILVLCLQRYLRHAISTCHLVGVTIITGNFILDKV